MLYIVSHLIFQTNPLLSTTDESQAGEFFVPIPLREAESVRWAGLQMPWFSPINTNRETRKQVKRFSMIR